MNFSAYAYFIVLLTLQPNYVSNTCLTKLINELAADWERGYS